jgi:hypothetical protein
MDLESPRWFARLGVLVALLSVASCGSARHPSHLAEVGARETGARIGPGDEEASEYERGGIAGPAAKLTRVEFTLEKAGEVDGTLLPAGARLVGLYRDYAKRWQVPPVYADVRMARSDWAFVKRHGEATWSRLSLFGAAAGRSPTAFHELRDLARDRTLAVTHESKERWTITVLDGDGRALGAFGDVAPGSWQPPDYQQRWFPPVSVLPTGNLLARHVDPTGAPYDVIYSGDGAPLTPELPPLRRDPEDRPSSLDIPLDPNRGLYWPVYTDGSVPIKPTAVDGANRLSRGVWAIVWKLPEGERHAIVLGDRLTDELVASSRSLAIYDVVESVGVAESLLVRVAPGQAAPLVRGTRDAALVRVAGQRSLLVVDTSTLAPMLDEVFDEVVRARRWLAVQQVAQWERNLVADRERAAAEKAAAVEAARAAREAASKAHEENRRLSAELD